jgi:putative flippase GtrA
MVAAGTLLNTALMVLLVMILQRHYLGSQIVTPGIVFLWNYWVSARWVFR